MTKRDRTKTCMSNLRKFMKPMPKQVAVVHLKRKKYSIPLSTVPNRLLKLLKIQNRQPYCYLISFNNNWQFFHKLVMSASMCYMFKDTFIIQETLLLNCKHNIMTLPHSCEFHFHWNVLRSHRFVYFCYIIYPNNGIAADLIH